MASFLILLASIPVTCLVVCSAACNVYCHSEAVAVVERWAKREGFRISRRRRRVFFRGPYASEPGGHIVFRVVLEGHDGLGKVAWINCGNPLWKPQRPTRGRVGTLSVAFV